MAAGSLLRKMEKIDFVWEIPDFFRELETDDIDDEVSSHAFPFSGCRWKLSLGGLNFREGGEDLYVFLTMLEPYNRDRGDKTVRFTCAVLTPNGTVVKSESRTDTFNEMDSTSTVHLDGLDVNVLRHRRMELMPLDKLTLAWSMQNPEAPDAMMELDAPAPEGEPPRPPELVGLEKMSSRFGALFASKKKCDVILKVRDKEFEAHVFVLMAQSPVFAAMFEHDTVEARTGIVTLPDCDPDAFGDFLRYLYTGKFELVTPGNALQLYVTADKYDVPELKSFCVQCMSQNLTTDNLCDVVCLAEQYEAADLMASAQNFFNRNLDAILAMPKWMTLMRANCELANRLFQQMAKAQTKND